MDYEGSLTLLRRLPYAGLYSYNERKIELFSYEIVCG